MSYDLAFWKSVEVPSLADSARLYTALMEGGAGVVPRSEGLLSAFYTELVRAYPDLTEENAAESPWSTPVWRTDEYVVCSFAHSRVQEMTEYLLPLSSQLGLLCFDPQSEQMFVTVKESPVVLELADGSVITGPAPEHVERAVQGLSPEDWYAILETAPGRFVQVALGAAVGVPGGSYALEVRDGSDEQQLRAVVDDVSQVLAAFRGFAAGDSAWRSGLDLAPVPT
jgi:hypothetical protein